MYIKLQSNALLGLSHLLILFNMNIKKNKIKTKALTTKQEGQNVCWNAEKMNQLPAAKKNYNFFSIPTNRKLASLLILSWL